MTLRQFDHVFQTKLHSWTKLSFAEQLFFSPQELNRLHKAEEDFDSKNRTIVFTFFENSYASLGGLAAISKSLPKFMQDVGRENALFVSPFHKNNAKIKQAYTNGNFVTIFEHQDFVCGNFAAKITCLQDISADVPSYFCALDDHFTPESNPYCYGDPLLLAHDALVFCAALPAMLSRLGFTKNLIFHAHDWECSAIALTSKMAIVNDTLSSAKTLLTLHNSYDSGLPASLMSKVFGIATSTDTFLQTFIPLLSGPLTAVSTPFAHELCFDPLQTGVFTRHLQQTFSQNPPIGIENGVFGNQKVPFSDAALGKCTMSDFALLLQEKNELRRAMDSKIQSCKNNFVTGTITPAQPGSIVPIFFMTGRPDFSQKGFDTMLLAFEKLERGKAKLFFGLNIDEKSQLSPENARCLEFLHGIVDKCPGDVTLWPFTIAGDDYSTLLKGASFQLMPSFYEPFGSVTEGFVCGTPILARATGGLLSQIEPCNPITLPLFYGNLFKNAKSTPNATGILYREHYPDKLAEKEWNAILKLPLAERLSIPLYASIVSSAHLALEKALEIYSEPASYGALIVNGIKSLSFFSWDLSVEKFRKVYDKALRNSL